MTNIYKRWLSLNDNKRHQLKLYNGGLFPETTGQQIMLYSTRCHTLYSLTTARQREDNSHKKLKLNFIET